MMFVRIPPATITTKTITMAMPTARHKTEKEQNVSRVVNSSPCRLPKGGRD